MEMQGRAKANPFFSTRMRELLSETGMSYRALATRTFYGKSYLQELAVGKKAPPYETALRIDDALGAEGCLAELAADAHDGPRSLRGDAPLSGVAGTDDEDRLLYVARHPRRVDTTAVDALGTLLAGQRRLEDAVGATRVLDPVLAQINLVEDLVRDAGGDVRRAVVDMASQWVQFAGWLSAQSCMPVAAREWYGRALEWATETGNANMVATALNMRGHLAWQAGEVGPVIDLSAAAARQPASPGVRALAVQQEARGHAMAGEGAETDRRLDQAVALAAAAAEHPDDEPPWVYFYGPAHLQLQRGLAYRLLGRYPQAIELLTAGLAAVPPQTRGSEWLGTYQCQLAVAHAQSGDLQTATVVLGEADRIVAATSSAGLGGLAQRIRVRFALSASSAADSEHLHDHVWRP
jgi:tetratricopeptide (TPR) repeat protein